MCLGVSGQIVAITDEARQMAMAEVSGVRREVNVACIALGEVQETLAQMAAGNAALEARA